MKNVNVSTDQLNSDLEKKSNWAYQWKMSFNPDPKKQVQEICDQASDLWQQPELASELESDLRDTVDWGKKWLVDFNVGKTQLVLPDQPKNTGAIDVKMDESVLEEKWSFMMLGLTLSSELDCLLYYLYCWNCLQENWSHDFFCEFSFSQVCSVCL